MSRTEPSSGSGSQSLFGDITSLFSLVLFLVFVTCALFTVTIGSRVYAGIQEKKPLSPGYTYSFVHGVIDALVRL